MPSQEESLILEDKHARKKGQLEGKGACVREVDKVCMQSRPNDARVRVFIMYCKRW
jgi:hypothetical protein